MARRPALRLGLSCLVATGCQTPKTTSTASTDPLYGEKQPEKAPGVTGPTPPPQNRAGMGSPASPPATASKSNAGLVIGSDPLLGGRTTAINDPPPPVQTPNNWQPSGPGGPGVILKVPETQQGSTTVPPPANLPGMSFQGGAMLPVPVVSQVNQAGFTAPSGPNPMDALTQRGMISHDQKSVPGGVFFKCLVRNPQDPDAVRVYEETAVDLPTAMNNVVIKIDEKQ